MTGHWKNYKTGQTVHIKDTIFEDNNLVGVTSTGQIINMNKLKDFVKYDPSKEPSEPKAKVNNNTLLRGLDTTKPTTIRTNTPAESTYYPEYYDYPFGQDSNIVSTTDLPEVSIPTVTKAEPIDPDIDVIHRVIDNLKKAESPVIDVKVKWEVPNSVRFLNEYLHVSSEKIADEVMKQFADMDKIREIVLKSIEKELGMEKPVETETPAEEKPKKPKPKK